MNPCTLCSCSNFYPLSGGQVCFGLNAAGGTCNHERSAHSGLSATEDEKASAKELTEKPE